jgi:hypothetical protein
MVHRQIVPLLKTLKRQECRGKRGNSIIAPRHDKETLGETTTPHVP